MQGFHFTKYDPNQQGKSKFQQLLDLFTQLLTHTSGDVKEALEWLNELDRQYKITDDDYGIGDFVEDLKDKGYITEENEKG
jgi:Ca-activated chloride channel family protein